MSCKLLTGGGSKASHLYKYLLSISRLHLLESLQTCQFQIVFTMKQLFVFFCARFACLKNVKSVISVIRINPDTWKIITREPVTKIDTNAEKNGAVKKVPCSLCALQLTYKLFLYARWNHLYIWCKTFIHILYNLYIYFSGYITFYRILEGN